MIKKCPFAILALATFLSISSCCTKKDCEGANQINEIRFYNFSFGELDTISFVSYQKNSNFGLVIDSAITKAREVDDHYTIFTNEKFKTNLDYKIQLVSSNKSFLLSGFVLEKLKCNTCFPHTPENDYYDVLSSYVVNGIKQSKSQIELYK